MRIPKKDGKSQLRKSMITQPSASKDVASPPLHSDSEIQLENNGGSATKKAITRSTSAMDFINKAFKINREGNDLDSISENEITKFNPEVVANVNEYKKGKSKLAETNDVQPSKKKSTLSKIKNIFTHRSGHGSPSRLGTAFRSPSMYFIGNPFKDLKEEFKSAKNDDMPGPSTPIGATNVPKTAAAGVDEELAQRAAEELTIDESPKLTKMLKGSQSQSLPIFNSMSAANIEQSDDTVPNNRLRRSPGRSALIPRNRGFFNSVYTPRDLADSSNDHVQDNGLTSSLKGKLSLKLPRKIDRESRHFGVDLNFGVGDYLDSPRLPAHPSSGLPPVPALPQTAELEGMSPQSSGSQAGGRLNHPTAVTHARPLIQHTIPANTSAGFMPMPGDRYVCLRKCLDRQASGPTPVSNPLQQHPGTMEFADFPAGVVPSHYADGIPSGNNTTSAEKTAVGDTTTLGYGTTSGDETTSGIVTTTGDNITAEDNATFGSKTAFENNTVSEYNAPSGNNTTSQQVREIVLGKPSA